ncbi:anhydro-N-acetylmuramic acid kinase [Roseobacter sp. HKCCA0434]|uniref:anhydro-N-acetylmuramic acid kinase n=1 Tax=Roseobacter sp. HKCCA0434 TaxID=3079297 RepID=UPI0029058081|nr:anhydro-N-acetylmuramic acid kinase [Roseobacter sp. HKCCA0434]
MRVVGLMSGTSMDGVDAALLETDGERILGFGNAYFVDYAPGEREALVAAQGQWPGESNALAATAEIVERRHIEAVQALPGAELVGFHGQTLAHDPGRARTHQLGDGAALAATLGVPVVWDFRSADMAAGGQGAPLAPFFHHACARWAGLDEPVAFLNLGGVGNVTWVDPTVARPEAPGALVAFDTGPANALIDDFMQERTGVPQDRSGGAAIWGMRGGDRALFDDPYFDLAPPKSLDRNAFRPVAQAARGMETRDGAAFLTAFTIHSVQAAQRHLPEPPARWLVCGGGRRNATMMAWLGTALVGEVDPVEAVGLDGDMLEAQAFAYLAARVMAGLPTSAPMTTGCAAPVCGGRVSYPG